MADDKGQVISTTETTARDEVMGQIGSLQRDIAEIRELLSRGHGVDRAIEEFRYMPPGLEEPIRWGFFGVRGRGGSSRCVHVHTNSEDAFFDDPDCGPEQVAALAAAFAHPDTIAVCRYLFRGGEATQEAIMAGCGLDEAALEKAVAPLLEWRFMVWMDGRLEYRSTREDGLAASINGQGINYAITLMAMAKTAFAFKERQERK